MYLERLTLFSNILDTKMMPRAEKINKPLLSLILTKFGFDPLGCGGIELELSPIENNVLMEQKRKRAKNGRHEGPHYLRERAVPGGRVDANGSFRVRCCWVELRLPSLGAGTARPALGPCSWDGVGDRGEAGSRGMDRRLTKCFSVRSKILH